MPDFSSNWKLTFNPGTAGLVIVTHGQRIAGELPAPWRQRTEEVPTLRNASMGHFARRNVSAGLSIGVYDNHADDAAARNWIAALHGRLMAYAGMTSTVRLEIAGGETYVITQAVIEEVTPVMVVAGQPRTLTQWRLKTGPWLLTVPPGPDPEPEPEPDPVEQERRSIGQSTRDIGEMEVLIGDLYPPAAAVVAGDISTLAVLIGDLTTPIQNS
jgi:hypothetical protein